MPAASPFLTDVLDSFAIQRQAVQRDVLQILDTLLEERHRLDDTRADLRRRQREDHYALEQADLAGEMRWTERLRRIEEWKAQVHELRQHHQKQTTQATALAWYQKALAVAQRSSSRLERWAQQIEKQLPSLSERLDTWGKELESDLPALVAFQHKQQLTRKPLLVSRARRKPLAERFSSHQATAQLLGAEVLSLKSRVNGILRSLHKVSRHLGDRSGTADTLLDPSRAALQEILLTLETRYLDVKDLLLDVLVKFEGTRPALKQSGDILSRMRCVEDVYRRNESEWTRFWRRALP